MTDYTPPAEGRSGDPSPMADDADESIERAELDGFTLDELSDYLDRDRSPRNDEIEASSSCQHALDELMRIRRLSGTVLAVEAEREPDLDAGWIQQILSLISLDAQAGRDIPLDDGGPTGELAITEGAVRGIVRSVGDGFEGILLGRTRLDGDVTVPGEPITVSVDASVFWGIDVLRVVAEVRQAISEALARHTRLTVVAIDVTVRDVQMPPTSEERP